MARPCKVEPGMKFGRWTVISKSDIPNLSDSQQLWETECSCGRKGAVRTGPLVYGKSKSCGCLQKEVASAIRTTHLQMYGVLRKALDYTYRDDPDVILALRKHYGEKE